MSELDEQGSQASDRRSDSNDSDRRAHARERKLQQALSDRSRFIARLSREMRSPLEAINGLADILGESNNLDENDRRQVQSIGKEASALRRMIDDLLDMSQIGSGDMELLTEPFTPGALCDEIGLAHTPRAEAKGLDLRVEVADDVPPIVVGDRYRVRQILVNLVSNAIKFTESGSVLLRVQVAGADEDGRISQVQFVVKDTGPGIPAAHAPYLFEPYRQLHSKDAKIGTGIGLTVTRMLTELMGGSVWFTSDEEGSTFICQLPLRQGRRVSDQEAVAGEAELLSTLGWEASVLIVDDSEVNSLLMSAQLTQLGHSSTLVSSGADALEMLKTISFDVVLMDWHMSGMDGLETSQMVRAMGSSISQPRIVAMRAGREDAHREESLAAGMDDYLSKPISLAALGEMINQWSPEAQAAAVAPPAAAAEAPEATPAATAPEEVVEPVEAVTLESLLAAAGGQQSAYSRSTSFVSQMRAWRRHFTDAVATGHLDSARATAQDMRTSAIGIGATQLAEACARFEAEAGDGADVKRLTGDVLGAANAARESVKVHIQALQKMPRAS